MNKPQTANLTGSSVNKAKESRANSSDHDRGLKRTLGIIKDVDVQKNGKLFVFVDVTGNGGVLHPFGQNKTSIAIIDSPLDLLLRFGGVQKGQLVEVFYRGIGETGSAWAHVIGDAGEELVRAREMPRTGFSVAASLPFEPMGII